MQNRRASFVCALALGFGLADFALAQNGQPTQQMVRVGSDGGLLLSSVMHKPVYETVTYQYQVDVQSEETYDAEVDGKTVTRTRTVTKPETRTAAKTVSKLVSMTMKTQLDLKTAKGFEVDGRPIVAADLSKRLTDKQLVVVSANDKMVPDYYAAVFKPGTVVLVLPFDPTVCTPGGGPGSYAPTPGPVTAPVPQAAPPPPPGVAPAPRASLRLEAPFIRPVSFQPPVPVPSTEAPAPPIEPSEESLFPQSPSPLIAFAARSGADLLKIRQYVETPMETELTVLANDSSVSRESQVKVRRITRHSETTTVPLKSVRFASSEAKDIAADRIKEKLGSGETTVLVSADGQAVDEFWLQNVQPKVLVLRGVKLPAVGGGGMMPALMPPQAMPVPVPGPPQPAPAPPAGV